MSSSGRRTNGPPTGNGQDEISNNLLSEERSTTPDAKGADERRLEDDEHARRLSAITSGFSRDEAKVRSFLYDLAPKVRSSALVALARMGRLGPNDVAVARIDPSPVVRRTLCELSLSEMASEIVVLLNDVDDRVVEACAFALGELGAVSAVDRLIDVARDHSDALCREAAVAALGAIGDPRSRETLLHALEDVAPIRRRAVIALSRFDDDEVTVALRGRLTDRDWQVRQAAEDVLELSASEEP